MEPEFKSWGKTPRFAGFAVVITEKIDGTNALVHVAADGAVRAGSRNRWLSPGKTTDNYGFAAWVAGNADALRTLGEGYHYGEWWGQGIGRGYGIEDRRLSLFNTRRWGAHNPQTPSCVSAVPILYTGKFTGMEHLVAANQLRNEGSVAQPGYMNPEGVILYYLGFDAREKFLLDKHNKHKWEAAS